MALDQEAMLNPLYRCLEREVSRALELKATVMGDLQSVARYCVGEVKVTNYLRGLVDDLSTGVVPGSWRAYPIPPDTSVAAFVANLGERLSELGRVAHDPAAECGKTGLRLGRLFSPEAYITASRQYAAQSRGWPLEELVLAVAPGSAARLDDQSFAMLDLAADNAHWPVATSGLELSSSPRNALPTMIFSWKHRESVEAPAAAAVIIAPLYLDASRRQLLLELQLAKPVDTPSAEYYQAGVAILASDL